MCSASFFLSSFSWRGIRAFIPSQRHVWLSSIIAWLSYLFLPSSCVSTPIRAKFLILSCVRVVLCIINHIHSVLPSAHNNIYLVVLRALHSSFRYNTCICHTLTYTFLDPFASSYLAEASRLMSRALDSLISKRLCRYGVALKRVRICGAPASRVLQYMRRSRWKCRSSDAPKELLAALHPDTFAPIVSSLSASFFLFPLFFLCSLILSWVNGYLKSVSSIINALRSAPHEYIIRDIELRH